jgi:zinc transporter ZupT
LIVEAILAIVLFFIAIVILVVLSAIIGFLPAIIAAAVVYFVFGHSLLYAAIAFVAAAFLWAIVRRK